MLKHLELPSLNNIPHNSTAVITCRDNNIVPESCDLVDFIQMSKLKRLTS